MSQINNTIKAYQKISKTNRTIVATLLLLVFMALVMADIFSSFIGCVILGALLLQFALEASLFLRSRKRRHANKL